MLLGREALRLYHVFFGGIGSLLKIPCLATLGMCSSISGGSVVLVIESLLIPNLETRGMGWFAWNSCSSLDFKYELRHANWRKSSAPNLAGRSPIAPRYTHLRTLSN